MTADPSDAASPRPWFSSSEGVIAPTTPEGRSGFLSDVVVELGLAPAEAVEEAVELSRTEGGTVEDTLIHHGVITTEQRAIAIAERNGHPYVDLFKFRIDADAARLIPPSTARRYRAVPIAFDADGALVVAIADPLDALAVSDIGVITKSETRVAVATDAGIDALLNALPKDRGPSVLSARGMDGIGAARSAGVSGWSLDNSIFSPGSPPPPAASPEPIAEPPGQRAPEPAPEQAAAPDLEGRIEALVAAAVDKRLQNEAAGSADQELERAREELALTRAELRQAREDAQQARAELAALTARLEQLERPSQPLRAAPYPGGPESY